MPTDSTLDSTRIMPPGPFLGRRIELAQLCRAVEEARLGRGARLWLAGSQGVGKSRLLAEIARYAAWRDVRVDSVDSGQDPLAPPLRSGPSLLIVDPVAPTQVPAVDERLCRAANVAVLGLATTSSAYRCLQAGIPKAALIAVTGLDSAEAFQLLEAWLGSALDPVWADSLVRSTHGHPGRMRDAAERFLALARGEG